MFYKPVGRVQELINITNIFYFITSHIIAHAIELQFDKEIKINS